MTLIPGSTPPGEDRRDGAPAEAGARVLRPWGWFETLAEGAGYRVKRLRIEARQRLSRQRHHHRHEQWLVLAGSGWVETGPAGQGGGNEPLNPGGRVEIAPFTIHRAGAGDDGLEILEVQRGRVLAEEDIERLADDYGRV